MKINLKNLKSQSGITLSSLMVTIIVMMILSVASISILSGNTGILDETETAVNEANKQVIIDEVKIMVSKFGVMWDGNETLRDYIVNKLQSYEGGYKTETGGKITVNVNGYVTYVDKNGRKIVFEDKEGLKKLKIDENGNVMEVAYTPPPEGLKIGSIVTYSPSGTYEWNAEYATSYATDSEEYANASKMLSSADISSTGFQITSWRVLSIDDDTGDVQLLPSTETNGKVTLQGSQGYNNAVKLLNDACSALYGDDKNGITARSINIEDLEGKEVNGKLLGGVLTDTAIEERNNYESTEDSTESVKYGERHEIALPTYRNNNGEYIVCKKYPVIYERERESIINIEPTIGTVKRTNLGLSEQTQLIERSEGTITTKGKEGAKTANVSIHPKETYYNLGTSYSSFFEKFKNYDESKSYASLMLPNSDKTNYFIASRCVYLLSNNCHFNVNTVTKGYMSRNLLDNSNGNIISASYSLFPVVSLNANFIQPDGTNFKVVINEE